MPILVVVSPGQQGDVELTLVSYATRAAYEKIIPEFTAKWKQDQQNITVNQSYGGSGSQARAS